MRKQRPDGEKIANELSGASAFFRPTAPHDAPASKAPPESTAPANAPAASPAVTSVTPPRRSVTTSRRHDVTSSPSPGAGFDINRETASHDTLRLAVDESRALEDLKSALKWEHDLTVSKNDICRVALHMLIEEYRANGPTSAALKRLRRKLGRHDVTKS